MDQRLVFPVLALAALAGWLSAVAPAYPVDAPHHRSALDQAFGAFERHQYTRAFRLALGRARQAPNGEENVRNITAAQVLLGELHRLGFGVPRNLRKARQWYARAAAHQSANGAFALAMILAQHPALFGQDDGRVADFLERAARKGHAGAQYETGLLYKTGEWRPKDPAFAFTWFAQAAAADHTGAQYELARQYSTGDGVSVNLEKALTWMGRAAADGHVAAQTGLGIMLFRGQGTDRNERRGARWLTRAARAGDPIAQTRIARLYAIGRGVKADPVAAIKWYLISQTIGARDDWLDAYYRQQAAAVREKGRAAAQDAIARWSLLDFRDHSRN